MTVTCSSCQRKYRLDPAKFAGKETVTVRCASCGATTSVALGPPTAPPSLQAPVVAVPPAPPVPAGDQTSRLAADAGLIPEKPVAGPAGEPALPEGMRLTLAVLEGKDSGRMFRIEHPSVVIGRGEGDIQIDDPEVSRRHLRITAHGVRIVLQDLGSTNGTFVDERKISEAEIENRSEFRVGGTRFMLIMAETGENAP
jgi:predicted Zn finger-like uncharacterized protein